MIRNGERHLSSEMKPAFLDQSINIFHDMVDRDAQSQSRIELLECPIAVGTGRDHGLDPARLHVSMLCSAYLVELPR